MSDQLQNLWIPDEEVERKDKKLRGNSEGPWSDAFHRVKEYRISVFSFGE